MKRYVTCKKQALLSAVLACLAAPLVSAESYIDSAEVKRSRFYTSEASAPAALEYVSLRDWFEYRKSIGSLDNAVISSGSFIIDDPALLEPVYALANRILAGWPGSIPRTAIFLQAGSTTSYDAVTTAENEIIIQMGAVTNADSMDELAAILAHEISHILLEHNTKLNYLAKVDDMFSQYARARTLAANIETLSYDGDELTFAAGPEYVRKIRQIERNQELAFRFYNSAYATLHAKGDEIEADQLAVDLMMKDDALYPSAFIDFFGKLGESFRFNTAIEKAAIEETTALLDQYAAEIKSLATSGESVTSKAEISNQLSGFSRTLRDRFKDILSSTMLAFLGSRHPVPEDRLKNFASYTEKEAGYPLIRINAVPPTEALDAYKADPAVSQVINNVVLGMKALDFGSAGSATEARTELEAQKQLGLLEDPFGAYVQYQVFRMTDDDASALAAVTQLSQYLALPVIDALQIGEFVLDQKGLDGVSQVKEIIRQKEEYLGSIGNFYPLKIQLAALENDSAAVLALATECVARYPKAETLYNQCAPHAGVVAPKKEGLFGGLTDIVTDGVGTTLDTLRK